MPLAQDIGPCPRCGEPVRWSGRGRRPRWCSTTCRQRAKEARRVARDNEQPILAVDSPARPRTADEWADHLTSTEHRVLLMRALDRVIKRLPDGRVSVPKEADAVIERMLGLPTGSAEVLRAGLPLPDDQERLDRWAQELNEAERRGYERGRQEAGRDRPVPRSEPTYRSSWAPTYTAASTAGLNRQQRRAATRAGRRNP